MMNRRLIVPAAAAALLAGVVWAFLPSQDVVEVVKPKRGPAVQAVYATGTVEATVMMPIAARAPARLMELNADEGSEVAKDRVLAKLENADLRHALDQAVAKEAYAQAEYKRYETLLQNNTVSRQVYDRARSDLDAARAAVKKAQAEVDFMTLVSPAEGRIIRRDGEVGQLIPANQPVFWLAVGDRLRVSAEVDEEDISLVRPGQEVLIRADAFPGQVFGGRVESITPKGDAVARSYRVRIPLTEGTPLLIGMTAETNIIAHRAEDALLLPAGVLLRDNKVWLVRDGVLVLQPVEVGAKDMQRVEIRSGVAPEDDVALAPENGFEAGMRVRAKPVVWDVP